MINLCISTQPDDETCGPTCLHAIYQYYGLDCELSDVIQGMERSYSGGTLAPLLGKHALSRGFSATIYVNNMDIFDPTWFTKEEGDSALLIEKLGLQMQYKPERGITESSLAYQQYLSLGGKVRFRSLTPQLLRVYFRRNIPVLTGLSATYLYRSARERYTPEGVAIYDDIRGTPCGHFVVLCGYDETHRYVIVADPHRENPLSHDNYYKVNINHLINAIMLGVLTYDANMLIIQPKEVDTCKLC